MVKLTPALISETIPNTYLQEITSLDLKNKDINDIDDISVCVELKRLDLKNNKIKDIKGIINNNELLWLSLANNSLKSISNIYNLKKLRVLNCSGNSIKYINTLSDLTNLQALVLNNNKITSIIDLITLKQLNTLVISNNRLESLEGIDKLKQLKKFSASYNKLSYLPKTDIHQGWGLQLQEIRLSHNVFSNIPESFKYLPNLKILDMGHNQIFEWKYVELINTLYALIHLNLAGNPICQQDNYHSNIRQLAPKVKILDGIKIVDDLRKRKRKRTNIQKEFYKKEESQPKYNKIQKNQYSIHDKVAPVIIRGRVSTGKRVKFDESDSEEEEINEIEEKKEKKQEIVLKNHKNIITKDNKQSKEHKKVNNKEKQKENEEKLKKSSGIISVKENKLANIKSFSINDLLEEETIGLGNDKW